MPRVPVYEQQVNLGDFHQVNAVATDAPPVAAQQMKEVGQGMMQAGRGLSDIALDKMREANNARVQMEVAKATEQSTSLMLNGMTITGENALKPNDDGDYLTAATVKKFDKHIEETEKTLSNDVQKEAYRQESMRLRTQLQSNMLRHVIGENEKFKDASSEAMIKSYGDRAVKMYGSPEIYKESIDKVNETFSDLAQRKGWTGEIADERRKAYLTPIHMGVVKSLIQGGHAEEAEKYINGTDGVGGVGGQMTLEGRELALEKVKPAIIDQAGENGANEIWATIGPKTPNAAVNIFEMEHEAAARFKGDPERRNSTITHLRQMAQAFNAQQNESNAAGVNGVYKLLDGNVPLAQVKRSDAWLSLPEVKRHEIQKEWLNYQESRTTNELALAQRAEKLSLLRNGNEYLTATSPEVLVKMSRAQVEAMRPKFGMDATQHLLDRWDQLQKPGALQEAKVDRDDFMQMADQMGLHPFKKDSSEDHKRMLGTLQYRVEQIIDREQKDKGRALTRQEKNDITKREIASTVTVNKPFWFNETKSAIALTGDEANQVTVPADDRTKITEALKAFQSKDPGNPAYAATEENIRKYYLMKKTKAASLINGK